jgi:hypothetical protein
MKSDSETVEYGGSSAHQKTTPSRKIAMSSILHLIFHSFDDFKICEDYDQTKSQDSPITFSFMRSFEYRLEMKQIHNPGRLAHQEKTCHVTLSNILHWTFHIVGHLTGREHSTLR